MSTGDACPLPAGPLSPDADAIARMLAMRRIAVVGLSDDPARDSHRVAAYLQGRGYEIVPVNPKITQTLGERAYADLADVPGDVDVVLVFRQAQYAPEIAREAAEKHARGLWLQAGILSPEARQIAQQAGMEYVEDRCMMVERSRN